MCKLRLSETNPDTWSTYPTHPRESESEEERERRRVWVDSSGVERESVREAVRVREMPCVGMSGWHSAGCLQSVILTPFPDKQISM